MHRYFNHLKTGVIYKMLYEAHECTNSRESLKYVVYVEADDEEHYDVFVRESKEFFEKFKEV